MRPSSQVVRMLVVGDHTLRTTVTVIPRGRRNPPYVGSAKKSVLFFPHDGSGSACRL